MKKITLSKRGVAIATTLVALAFACPSLTHAASLSTNQTVANFAAVNDQTDVTTPTQANVPQTKATRTITVVSLPANGVTLTIGTCVVTFNTGATQDTSCSDNVAAINTTTDSTAAAVAARLQTFTGVSDTGHGALTVATVSGTATSFTTTGTETSATVITASLSAGTSITLTTVSTAGVIPVAQINTVTVGGTIETGDTYTITIPTGVYTFNVGGSDHTTTDIANEIGANIVASSTYSTQPFTVATSTNTVVITAKVAGTGFTQTSGTTNTATAPAAQAVTFTPSGVTNNTTLSTFSITLNSNTYSYTYPGGVAHGPDEIVTGLVAAAAADSAVSCGGTTGMVTCTAKVAGTPFTYGANVVTAPVTASGVSGGSGHSSNVSPTIVVKNPSTMNTGTSVTTTSTASTPSFTATVGASMIKSSIGLGSNSASVTLLQKLLSQDASLGFTGAPTGHFGPITLAAVEKFQVKYSIATPGTSGYGTVGPKTRAKLVAVFGQ